MSKDKLFFHNMWPSSAVADKKIVFKQHQTGLPKGKRAEGQGNVVGNSRVLDISEFGQGLTVAITTIQPYSGRLNWGLEKSSH